jgi:hypothetical protein
MDASLRGGIALYNDGEYRAARHRWEEDCPGGAESSDDERFLHGLARLTDAVARARARDWGEATDLAANASEALAGLESPYRGVDLAPVRRTLAALAADPVTVERRRPPPLRYEGRVLTPDQLRFEAAAAAAAALGAVYDYDADVIDRAVTFARDELADGERTLFTGTLLEFVDCGGAERGLVFRRLAQHVDRRAREDADVAGLFDQ